MNYIYCNFDGNWSQMTIFPDASKFDSPNSQIESSMLKCLLQNRWYPIKQPTKTFEIYHTDSWDNELHLL